MVKNLPAMQEIRAQLLDVPGSGTSPGGKNGNPFQYSCLENSIDRGAWWATIHEYCKESDMTEQLTLSLSFL